MKKWNISRNYENVTQRHQVSKCCWKNGAKRPAQHKAVINLQFVKNTVPAKRNKVKHNKTRYA